MTTEKRIIVSKTLTTKIPKSYTVNKNKYKKEKSNELDGSKQKSSNHTNAELKLMMICCDEKYPYGPATETATNFLDTIVLSIERHYSSLVTRMEHATDAILEISFQISITVYHAQLFDYPRTSRDWDEFDGIILPGSTSTAYEEDGVEWIRHFQKVIRDEIHSPHCRKTLGVCFGHQILAHALKTCRLEHCGDRNGSDVAAVDANVDKNVGIHAANVGGLAVQCPTGTKAGRKSFQLTPAGKAILVNQLGVQNSIGRGNNNNNKDSMELFYTHGDMVQSLPSISLSLGGNEDVPIHSAAYFESIDHALQFQRHSESIVSSALSNGNSDANNCTDDACLPLPYAITFQAHPEYISPNGFQTNYRNCMMEMENHGRLVAGTYEEQWEDSKTYLEQVLDDSLDAMIAVGITFGWF